MAKRKGDTSEKAHLRRMRIVRAVQKDPGKYTKARLANKFNVAKATIHEDLRKINAPDSTHYPVRYGFAFGRYGYFCVNLKGHVVVLDQHDETCKAIQVGIHDSRKTNLEKVSAMRQTPEVQEIIARIEARLGIRVDDLSESDREAFFELVEEE